jgi:hypothetical protein
MASQAEYAAGIQAAVVLIQSDIRSEVPRIFQGRLTPELIASHAEAIAKAVIDAAERARDGAK